MRIKVTEIEADARELRENNTLASNFAMMLQRAFQSREPFDDNAVEEDEDGEEHEDNRRHRTYDTAEHPVR